MEGSLRLSAIPPLCNRSTLTGSNRGFLGNGLPARRIALHARAKRTPTNCRSARRSVRYRRKTSRAGRPTPRKLTSISAKDESGGTPNPQKTHFHIGQRRVGRDAQPPENSLPYRTKANRAGHPTPRKLASISDKGESGGTPNPQKTRFHIGQRRIGRDAQPPENSGTPSTVHDSRPHDATLGSAALFVGFHSSRVLTTMASR
jgi:hypothetical protein